MRLKLTSGPKYKFSKLKVDMWVEDWKKKVPGTYGEPVITADEVTITLGANVNQKNLENAVDATIAAEHLQHDVSYSIN
jgi:hypothetical protein